MAEVSSDSNTGFPVCLIDVSFDLDEALTLPQNFGRRIAESDSSIAALPTVSSTDDVCSICMEGFRSDKAGKQLPCGHVYHAPCISSWISNCNSCPLCRCNISGE